MAGMPDSLIARSQFILKELEKTKGTSNQKEAFDNVKEDFQLSIFQLDDPVLSQIRDEITSIDINSLTPVEALLKLNEIKKLIGKK